MKEALFGAGNARDSWSFVQIEGIRRCLARKVRNGFLGIFQSAGKGGGVCAGGEGVEWLGGMGPAHEG
jgi:hypothetical protein